MTAYHLYAIIGAVAPLILDGFLPIYRRSYSAWLVPLIIVGVFLVLVILQLLVLLIMTLAANTEKKAKCEPFFRLLVKNTVPLLLFISGGKVKAEGLEKLPENTPVFFVCNHQHDFDPLILFYCFPDAYLSFVGKKDILDEMPFVAKLMHRLSCLFIDRENDRAAAKTIVSAIKRLKEGEGSLALFPEGYTSKDGNIQPLRNGSLKVALKSGAPMAVCVIDGTKNFAHSIFKRRSVVNFRLVDVIYSEEYGEMNTAALGEKVHTLMCDALEDIRNG